MMKELLVTQHQQ